MITVKGLGYFWPQPLVYYDAPSSQSDSAGLLGILVAQQSVNEQADNGAEHYQYLLKLSADMNARSQYRWVIAQPAEFTRPLNATVVERVNGSQLFGFAKDEMSRSLASQNSDASLGQIRLTTLAGEALLIPTSEVVEYYQPNDMSVFAKLGYFVTHFARFVRYDSLQGNAQGGVFPAIFGTVFLVFLMTLLVAPMGVIAAIYLHEYAQKTVVTRIIRIAVVNLAGVPSIVYGVFGLGFFVYFIGSGIDNTFYADSLPTPTFGEPGVLWAALTMALLTLPVVIVATEEGLSRIPKHTKLGCMALGATRLETIMHVLLPIASPAIITGLILAIARAAGEVAPLMLVGVVKSAPALPVDGTFPFVHLDRQFMHLGYQIFDVGFQSPSMDTSRPLVYATAMLLILVIVSLNITAVAIRNHLTHKYRGML